MIEDMDYHPGETPLDADEMAGLKFSHITTRGELNHLEQANIESGLLWLGSQKMPELLTEHFTRKLHKQLFGEVWQWAGSFRQTEKTIGIDPIQISIQLRLLLNDMQYWVDNGTYVPMEAADRFHHRLVYIHPFPNGNGRHARIMADAVLGILFDEKTIDWSGGYNMQEMNKRRAQYIDALRTADAGDYGLLFEFVGYQ